MEFRKTAIYKVTQYDSYDTRDLYVWDRTLIRIEKP